jgi:hypothetical protein
LLTSIAEQVGDRPMRGCVNRRHCWKNAQRIARDLHDSRRNPCMRDLTGSRRFDSQHDELDRAALHQTFDLAGRDHAPGAKELRLFIFELNRRCWRTKV